MKTTINRGSALVLVLIALIILSLIGLAALTQTGSEINTAGNFYKDKSTFYAADAGIQIGIREIRLHSITPKQVKVDGTIGKNNYRTGHMTDPLPTAKNVERFRGFMPAQPVGQTIDMNNEPNLKTVAWELAITAESNTSILNLKKNQTRKQVQTVLYTQVPMDY